MKEKRLASKRRRLPSRWCAFPKRNVPRKTPFTWAGLTFLTLCAGLLSGQADPAMRIVKSSANGADLIQNGDFQQAADGKLRAWTAAPQGFVLSSDQGRKGSQALECDSRKGQG